MSGQTDLHSRSDTGAAPAPREPHPPHAPHTALASAATVSTSPRPPYCYSTNPLHMAISARVTSAVIASRTGIHCGSSGGGGTTNGWDTPTSVPPHGDGTTAATATPSVADVLASTRPVTAPHQRITKAPLLGTAMTSPIHQRVIVAAHSPPSTQHRGEADDEETSCAGAELPIPQLAITPGDADSLHAAGFDNVRSVSQHGDGLMTPQMFSTCATVDGNSVASTPVCDKDDAIANGTDTTDVAEMLSTPTARAYLDRLLSRPSFSVDNGPLPRDSDKTSSASSAAALPLLDTANPPRRFLNLTEAGAGVPFVSPHGLQLFVPGSIGSSSTPLGIDGAFTRKGHSVPAASSSRRATNPKDAPEITVEQLLRDDDTPDHQSLAEFSTLPSLSPSTIPPRTAIVGGSAFAEPAVSAGSSSSAAAAAHGSAILRTVSLMTRPKFPPELNSGIPFVDFDTLGDADDPSMGSVYSRTSADDRVVMTFQVRLDGKPRSHLLRTAAQCSLVMLDKDRHGGQDDDRIGPVGPVTITIGDHAPLEEDREGSEAYFVELTPTAVSIVEFVPVEGKHTRARRFGNIMVQSIVDVKLRSVTELVLGIADTFKNSNLLRARLSHVNPGAQYHTITLRGAVVPGVATSLAVMSLARQRQLQDTSRKRLAIVHFNDVYNLIAQESPDAPVVGGAARFHTRLMELRQAENPLVLFSGDFMGPSLMSVDMKGKQMVDFFNQCGVHYACFGNHEFDYGLKALQEAVQGFTLGAHVFTGSTTTWVMSNLIETATGHPVCGSVNRALFTWNSVRVGIVGLCEDWLGGCSQLVPGELQYIDVFQVGEATAQQLRDEGAEIVIALTHCRLANDKEIMRRCPSIDLLLGGHDHFYKCIPGYRIIKSGEEFQYLTSIHVEITHTDLDGSASRARQSRGSLSVGSVETPTSLDERIDDSMASSRRRQPPRILLEVVSHPIHGGIEPSANMNKMIARYDAKLNERMGGVVGRTPLPLDPRESCCRFREGLLTGFVCDVVVEEMRSKVMNVDFAVIGGAAFSGKTIIPAGELTMGHIFDLFPNDTRVMCMRMPGKTVRKLLAVMARECPAEAPSFPHCSADLTFRICLIGGGPPKIKDICVGGEPIEDDRNYLVAVEDFAGKGNGKYKFLRTEAELLVEEENAVQVVFWLIDWFSKKKGQSRNTNKALEEEAARAQLESKKKRRRRRQPGGDTTPNTVSTFGTSHPKFSLPLKMFRAIEFSATLDAPTLARVYAASNLLTDDVESQNNVDLIEKVVVRLLRCTACRLYLMDQTTGELRALVNSSLGICHAPLASIPADATTLAGYAVLFRSVVNIKSTARDPAYRAAVDGSPHIKISNMLTFPIFYRKRCLGVVQAINKLEKPEAALNTSASDGFGSASATGSSSDSSGESSSSSSQSDGPFLDPTPKGSVGSKKRRVQPPSFTDEDQGLALLLSRQIGMRLHFSNMFQTIKRSEVATKNLLEMARLLGRAQKDDSVQQMVLRITEVGKQLIGCDRCSLFLLEKGDMWTVVKSKDLSNNITIRLRIGTGVAGQAAKSGMMLNIHDAYQSPYFNPDTDRKTGYVTKTILAVPMMNENQSAILGVLQLINKNDGTVFSAADEELAQNFVSLAAVAVHNSFEIETLRVGRDDSTLQVMPVHDLTRITITGGWNTVRAKLCDIVLMGKEVPASPLGVGSEQHRHAHHRGTYVPTGMVSETSSTNLVGPPLHVSNASQEHAHTVEIRGGYARQSAAPLSLSRDGTKHSSHSSHDVVRAPTTPTTTSKQQGIADALMDFDDLASVHSEDGE